MASIGLTISGILAILVGILVLAVPGLLRWAVGVYLIIAGILSFVP
ncbi:MAG: DUF3096 domain-containing protein [Nanoarchaeota archaeon]